MTVSDKLIEQTGIIGEKIEVGGFKILRAPYVGSYIHAGNKIATLTGLSEVVNNSGEISKNVAMQAAAMNPIALDENGVDSSIVEKEIEIAKDQLRQEGKPESMLDNIAKGKLKRFFKDNTLVNQAYIKDSKQTVSQYVSSNDQNLKITGFSRLSLV
jgi:elongation factor Ts